MTDLASLSWPALYGTAFVLGARHALDADHLTVIDALARRHALRRPRLAALGGMLFSVGHVAVVALVALATASLASRATLPPAWLVVSGTITSGIVLLLLGLLNLRAAWAAPAGSHAAPVGWKARFAGRAGHPLAIAVTGALFAISFDTIALAFAIGLAAKAVGAPISALVTSAVFGSGMILVGSANGAWTVRLLRSASRHAPIASRIMVGTIGSLNVALALVAFSTLLLTSVDAWRDRNGLWVSAAVIGCCCVGFFCALWLTRGSRQGGNRSSTTSRHASPSP